MLKSLRIENYILVKNLEIDFSSGLNLFSGETGAGKSVIIEAVNTVMGGSVQKGMLFDKEKDAVLEVVFSINDSDVEIKSLIEETGIDGSDYEISFTKIIKPGLKAASYLNGIRTTNTVIRKFKNVLLDFHSQREQQQLFDSNYQLQIIDSFGSLNKEKNAFTIAYNKCKSLLQQLQSLRKKEEDNRNKFDLFSYQLKEIEDCELKAAEDNELAEELNILTNAEELINLQQEYRHTCFEKENSIFDLLNSFISRLAYFTASGSRLQQAVSQMEECLSYLEEAGSLLDDTARSIDLDPQKLKSITERLDMINSLKAKYNRSLEDIIAYAKEIKMFIKSYSSDKEIIAKVEKNLEEEFIVLKNTSRKLSSARNKTAEKFSQIIERDIKGLSMPEAKVEVKLSELAENEDNFFPKITEQGNDLPQIFFSANKGKEMQPLKTAASGGELSRFLLAVKKILALHLQPKTIVFDEIDTGIGGKTAELTGKYIYDIASSHQVICITHLAQIAVFAQSHFLIKKETKGKFTEIEVKKLDNNQKVYEIARMLSGSDSTSARKHAEEIIRKAGRINV